MSRNPSILSRPLAAAPFLISPLAAALLVACGGGGGDSAPLAPLACATNCVSGVAASGKAIASATVTLTDAAGTTRSATTGADGSYQIDSTGLIAPFLLKVVAGTGTTFYSVSADANAKTTVNLSQLSDLLVRTWYGVQGIDAATAFGAPAANPAPPAAVLPDLAASVMGMVQLWLDRNNVPAGFNLISTPFTANGSGIDAVLDLTNVTVTSPSAVTLTMTSGTTTQTTSLVLGSGSVTATSTTADSATGTQSSSVTTSAVVVSSALSTALDTMRAGLNAFAATVNTKGAALAAADLQPYVDPNLLDDGKNAAQSIAESVGSLAGSTISFAVLNVDSIDLANGSAELNLQLTQSLGGQSNVETRPFRFKLIGTSWLITGNNRAYRFDAQAEMRNDLGANGGWSQCNGAPGGPGMSINIDVRAPTTLFSGGSVSGGGAVWPNNKDTPTSCVTGTALAAGGTSIDGADTLDNFFMNTGPIAPADLPPVGTPITVSMLPTGGGAAIPATVTLNAWTSDPTAITAPTNSALASITFGAAVPVSWTLPTTYAIQNVRLGAQVFDGDSSLGTTTSCSVDQAPLAKNATSGSIVIPATCNGHPVLQVSLNLNVNGVNGERSSSIFSIK